MKGMWSSTTTAVSPLEGRPPKAPVEPGVRGRLSGDLQVAIADQVEEVHRLDPIQRRRPLPTSGRGQGDELAASAQAVDREVASRTGLLGVEEGQRYRRTRERARQHPRQLQQHRHPGAPSLAPTKPGIPAFGVVVGADHHRARARDRRSSRRRCGAGAGRRESTPAARSRSTISATSSSPAAEPAGRGPISTCARRSAKARSASKPGAGPGAAPRRRRRRRARPAPPPSARLLTVRRTAVRLMTRCPSSTSTASARSTPRSSATRRRPATCTSGRS